jgi:predicted transcriptional regulator
MSKSQVITARIDPEVMALVDRLAAAQGRSRSWLAARAIEKMARAETAFLDFVKEGEDAIARGEYLTQEEMEAWIEERVRNRQAVRQAAE